jgi:hypothetical protein
MGSIQNGQRGRDSENQSCRNRGGHRSSQTIKHRTPRCRADRTAPANSVGIGEAAGAKNMSIKKLREMVFGRRTEKRRSARREERKEAAEAEQGEEAKTGSERSGESSSARKMIIKGHGRKPASAYSGAKVVICRHPEYQAGDRCPDPFCDGHLYQINPPNSLIQFTGRPLIEATKYRCEVLRCWIVRRDMRRRCLQEWRRRSTPNFCRITFWRLGQKYLRIATSVKIVKMYTGQGCGYRYFHLALLGRPEPQR